MKRMDIEALVAWAFREELPKVAGKGGGVQLAGFGGAWGGVERYGQLMTIVDEPKLNRFGVAIDAAASRDPHPDAVVVGEAVMALDVVTLGDMAGWDPLDDADGLHAALTDGERAAAVACGLGLALVAGEGGAMRPRLSISALVRRQAILGGAPDWRAEAPERRVVTANGMPRWFRKTTMWAGSVDEATGEPGGHGRYVEVEVDGFDRRRRIPLPDAYNKHYLDPDPAEAVAARFDYETWHGALCLLLEDLDGRLVEHVAVATGRSRWPWVEGEAPAARVLVDLRRPVVAEPAAGRRKRPRGSDACGASPKAA